MFWGCPADDPQTPHLLRGGSKPPLAPRTTYTNISICYSFLDRPKCLILVGPSRIGKTIWARSLGSHMYFNGLIDYAALDNGKKYVVLDDINIEYLPHYKSWIGSQREFTVNPKYGKHFTFRWGKPCIWLGNYDPRRSDKVDSEWISRNSIYVQLTDSLFH